jgi:hypothetical protein
MADKIVVRIKSELSGKQIWVAPKQDKVVDEKAIYLTGMSLEDLIDTLVEAKKFFTDASVEEGWDSGEDYYQTYCVSGNRFLTDSEKISRDEKVVIERAKLRAEKLENKKLRAASVEKLEKELEAARAARTELEQSGLD